MDTLKALIWLVNIFSALAVIVLVLMQQGKGADAGAAFGSGSADGVFGAAGSANFLSRSTKYSAIVFFATCLLLAYMTTHKKSSLDFSNVTPITTQSKSTQNTPVQPTAPVAPKPVVPE